jgi:ABC-2 type transport system permease protein
MSSSEPSAAYAFPYLLQPALLSLRNRSRRRQRGDLLRVAVFALISLAVGATLFALFFWLTWQLLDYAELGDYLVRLGLSWLFLTFLSFLAFSGVVTALSTFFLSEDLRLLVAAPVAPDRLFYSRFARTVAQASWMVVTFLLPVLLGVGLARCAGPLYYVAAAFTVTAFSVIPVAVGCAITLALVNLFPARRARDVLMLMGVLFAVVLVLMLRFLQPERLMRVESLPDVTAFFATLQSPLTPLLPSSWAGEVLFGALQGSVDWLHAGALATTALASAILCRAAYGRYYFSGWSKAQEARKARFTRLVLLERLARRLPLSCPARQLLVKDVKVFLRDTTQWSQLLLLVALALVYLYNFRVLDLDRIPYMSAVVKNAYAFVNLAMAAFVLSAVSVRFVFPSVSAEGAAFWIVRSSPVSMRAFLWSKFWTGLVPLAILSEALTFVSNEFLGVEPFLKVLAAIAILGMSVALVGLAAGLGAQYPRFQADNVTQVAGSYGGVAYMILAVLFILAQTALLAWIASVYLWHRFHGLSLPLFRLAGLGTGFVVAAALCALTCWLPMQRGVRALEELGGAP